MIFADSFICMNVCSITLSNFSCNIKHSIMQQIFQSIENKNTTAPLANPVKSYHALKLLQETASLSHLHPPRSVTSYQPTTREKSLPSITIQMNRNRDNLHSTMNSNHSKLNATFCGYLRNQLIMAKDELRKKKIRKFIKIEQKGDNHVEVQPLERDQTYLEGNFKMTALLNRCFDSLFPSLRYSPTLFSYDKNIYLLGGYHKMGAQGFSLFHTYEFENRKWVQVKYQGEAPKVSPSYHTVQIYRGHMVVIGGVTMEGQKGKRFNCELLVFNIERGQWLKARGGISLKNHASTLFGSTIMVSGGINEKDKFNQELYFITFTGGNVHAPLILSVHNHEQAEVVSHHQLVNTYELEGSLRNQVRYEGVFSFGGQNQNGALNNNISFINVIGKGGQNLDIKFKKWELIVTNDDKPCPRKEHTMTFINKKGVAVVAGGIDQFGRWLEDIWLFDFIRINWTRVNTSPSIPESVGFLAGHCACAIGSCVYFYNGNVDKKREKAFWMLETQSSGYKTKKTIFSTKLPSFKSLMSNKELLSISRI